VEQVPALGEVEQALGLEGVVHKQVPALEGAVHRQVLARVAAHKQVLALGEVAAQALTPWVGERQVS